MQVGTNRNLKFQQQKNDKVKNKVDLVKLIKICVINK